jgi:hypothetical protein
VVFSAPANATVSEGGIALAVDDAANLVEGDIVLNCDPFFASDARATSLSANLNIEFNARWRGKPASGSNPGPGPREAWRAALGPSY